MLTAVTIALAVALVLQDIDSALVILAIASTVMIAFVVLRPGSADRSSTAADDPREGAENRRSSQPPKSPPKSPTSSPTSSPTGPHSALT
jgi:hypothetical protein